MSLRRKELVLSEIPSLSGLAIQDHDRLLEETAELETTNGKVDEMKEQKKKEVGILPPRRGASLRESSTPSGSRPQSTAMTPSASATGDQVLGDETGPRFAFGTGDQMEENMGKNVEFEKREEEAKEESDEGFSGLNDSRAKKGEAGWPGIYRGDNVCRSTFQWTASLTHSHLAIHGSHDPRTSFQHRRDTTFDSSSGASSTYYSPRRNR